MTDLPHGALILREQRSRVELAADLAVELAHTPAAAQGFCFVEDAFFW